MASVPSLIMPRTARRPANAAPTRLTSRRPPPPRGVLSRRTIRVTWTCRRCGTSFDAAGQPDAGLVGQVLLRSLGDGATVILEPEAGERDEVETILDEAGMLGSTPAARERLVGLGLAACADPDRSGADHLALPPACPVCHGRRMAVVRPWEDVVDDDVPVAARTRWHRLHRSGRSRLVLQVVAASLAALE